MIQLLDHTLSESGLDPFIFAREIPDKVRRAAAQNKDFWKNLAISCGQREPSQDSINQILATYDKRAAESRQVAS